MLIQWRWYYHLPGASVCLLAIASLVLTRSRWQRHGWLILIPVVLTFILIQLDGLGILLALVAAVWLIVGLFGRRLFDRGEFVACEVVEDSSAVSFAQADGP